MESVAEILSFFLSPNNTLQADYPSQGAIKVF